MSTGTVFGHRLPSIQAPLVLRPPYIRPVDFQWTGLLWKTRYPTLGIVYRRSFALASWLCMVSLPIDWLSETTKNHTEKYTKGGLSQDSWNPADRGVY